ncbi:MAG: 30S ribosome-binding factor RbfA [Porphyromonas sp.]|nr:30S ribosome-binding factor RbfA [Porphyromonas sp.]
MDQRRTNKISRLIQKELGQMFQEETQTMRGVMISVTEVRVTPDLSSARVYLSIFPDEQSDHLLNQIKNNSSSIRGELGNRIRSQVRHIPELIFEKDMSEEYARRIDQLLDGIREE